MPKWTKTAVAIGLVLYLALTLLSLNFQEKPSVGRVQRVIVWVVSPMQNAMMGVVHAVGDMWNHYFALVGIAKRQNALMQERDTLKRRMIELKEVELENHRLRELLDLPLLEGRHWLTAERMALGASSYERVIRVKRGKRDGVQVGAVVMNPRGVVGQVLDVFERSSNVLLLVDLASAIDVVCQRTRAKGILKGSTIEQLRFEYLSKEEDMSVGDEVVSSGLDGIYPSGIPVGVVTEVQRTPGSLFLSARVKPHVDFTKLEEVAILLEEES